MTSKIGRQSISRLPSSGRFKVPRHLVTGGTGFVGRHLVADLLGAPDTEAVTVLARSSGAVAAAERVTLMLAGVDPQTPTKRLRVLESTLLQANCGVAAESVPGGDGPLVFWHLAASLEWRRGRREQVFAANVQGTQHALDLASTVGADLFVYMSTAYASGSLHGDVPEVLHRPPAFGNVYEESKCAAEHLVSGRPEGHTLILRPSVIVGNSKNYKPSGSYTGLYGYLSEIRRFKKMLGDSTEKIRFQADREARISLIPVDHVVADSRSVVDAALAQPGSGIHHLTGRSECSVGETTDYILALLGLADRLTLVDGEIDQPTTLERLFAKRIEFFSAYLRDERRFMRSISPDRVVTMAQLRKYIDGESTI